VLYQRTDVFSLGAVLYEMAAGHTPFGAQTSADTLVAILGKEPPLLEDYTPDVPAEFQRIVSKALRKDREERYQTIKDLLIDLKSLKEELSFAQRLERSRPPRSNVEVVRPTAAPLQTDQAKVVATDPSAAISEGRKRNVVLPVLAIVVLAGLLIGGLFLWRRRGATPPPIASAPVAQRSVSYWITVKKYRDGKPYQEPFRLSDDINFEKDYRLRLSIKSAQSGRLYLLNEGPTGADQTPTYNVMFPTETANKDSALVNENQLIQIPEQSWFQFDEQQGTEKIWVVWSAREVPEMEAVKGFANSKDRGVIPSPGLRTAISQFLKAHSSAAPSIERDQDKKETVVRANGEILVHVIKLEHH
jgi:hypothetical protein